MFRLLYVPHSKVLLADMVDDTELGIEATTRRILLVNWRHFPGGGDSNYTLQLAQLLRDNGYKVGFFAMQDPRNLPDPNADLFVDQIDFRELNQHKSLAAAFRVLRRSIWSVEARRRFGQMLDRFQPDVVHLQNIHAHISPSVIFEAKRRGIHVVWTLHDYKLVCPNSHFLIDATGEICEACGKASYYQAVLKRCKKGSLMASGVAALEAYAHKLVRVTQNVDAFVVPSRFLMSKLLERGFSKRRLHYVPHFLPDGVFTCADEPDGQCRALLFMGRLEAMKGIPVLIRACSIATDVRVILAGPLEGPLASSMLDLAPPNVLYVGEKHGEALRGLLREAAAIVMPSVCYENQPFSILEAFASGKPVIASDLGGMKELVEDGERGLLVPPGDERALAQAMRRLIQNPEMARKMGKRACSYVKETHSPEHHLQLLARVYALRRTQC